MSEVKVQVFKEQVWAEIRDLLEFKNGPASQIVKDRVRKLRQEDLKAFRQISKEHGITCLMEYMRCQLIAERAAVLGSATNSPWHGDAPSSILVNWAKELRENEVNSVLNDLFSNGGQIQIVTVNFDPSDFDPTEEDEDED